MEYNTTNKFKMLSKPIMWLFVILLVFAGSLLFGINQLKKINSDIVSLKTSNLKLTEKVETLRNIQNIVSENITLADIAIPNENVSLFAINQIRLTASETGVGIEKLRTSSLVKETNNLDKITITFDASGNAQNIFQFFNSLQRILPIGKITKINLSLNEDLILTSVTVNFYSTENIKQIPAVTGQIDTLTKEEIDALTDLSNYQAPQFSNPTPNEFPIRDDLFN